MIRMRTLETSADSLSWSDAPACEVKAAPSSACRSSNRAVWPPGSNVGDNAKNRNIHIRYVLSRLFCRDNFFVTTRLSVSVRIRYNKLRKLKRA